jgi:hypothetical protein
MRSFSANFGANPATDSVASAPAESQPVYTALFSKFFGKNLEDFGSVS